MQQFKITDRRPGGYATTCLNFARAAGFVGTDAANMWNLCPCLIFDFVSKASCRTKFPSSDREVVRRATVDLYRCMVVAPRKGHADEAEDEAEA